MLGPPACLIANPAAGGGRGARALAAARAAMAAVGVEDVRITTGPGDEERLAQCAAGDGMETIVALGGDGTWSGVARGILASGRDVRLALMAAGTGNDFGHSLGLPVWDYPATARLAVSGDAVAVDVGLAGGIPFLNVAGVGIQTAVLERTQDARILTGSLRYVASALPLLHRYRAFPLRARTDTGGESQAASLAIIASNGVRFGGGFRIAPQASVTDGLLDFVAVRDAAFLRRVSLFVSARLGAHLGQPEISHEQARSAVWHFESPPMLDIDGELRRASSAKVEVSCLPAALRLVTRDSQPWSLRLVRSHAHTTGPNCSAGSGCRSGSVRDGEFGVERGELSVKFSP